MDTLTTIADLAEQLCDPHQHVETVWGWDRNRNRKARVHRMVLPGLLAQLHDRVQPSGTSDGGRGAFASRPPLQVEALSTYVVITLAAARWCWDLRVDLRTTVEDNVRALVGAASRLDDADRRRLRADLARWRAWCAVMTEWERVDSYPGVACPNCDAVGSLRVNLTTEHGYCANPTRGEDGEMVCGATWSMADGSLRLLGRYITSVRRQMLVST